ncbi:hypothetical protein PMZ80_007322 [Knufia obscura]|uniref:Uncharacterized protein n=2 Tax=Knufia TaxID=430999 RepID=A0AAN8EDW5_9EURO|nr:hypothetical protein PMZ80_007322 [Knufia obscura]KAK5953334.1 hypothetical protein OHC33_005902 [Knufia fluminis]
MADLNQTAAAFKALHVPGQPLILANVYDILSAEAVAPLPSCKALATASYAIAKAAGTTDSKLTLEANLEAVRKIAKVAQKHNKPLTVDLQDGYGDRLEEAVRAVIEAGGVGVNIEDVDKETGGQYSQDDAVARVGKVLEVAKAAGVPEFVVNARCDSLMKGGTLEDTISRGHAYLEAGATTIFVMGGPQRGVRTQEVEKLNEAFQGRLNVVYIMTSADGLRMKELKEIGVARISVGPQLMMVAMGSLAEMANGIFEEGA